MTADDNTPEPAEPELPENFLSLLQGASDRVDELERRFSELECVFRCRVKGETCDQYAGSMRSVCEGSKYEGLSCEDVP